MKNKKKIIVVLLGVMLFILRYRFLNGNFNVNYAVETQIFGYNEIIELGDNNCSIDKNMGWKIQLKNYSITDIVPDKLIIINVVLYNDNKEESTINLRNFELLGIDWFETVDVKQSFEYNVCNCDNIDSDLNLTLQSKSLVEIALAFKICREKFSDKRFIGFNNEKMKLEITTFPVNKLIQVI